MHFVMAIPNPPSPYRVVMCNMFMRHHHLLQRGDSDPLDYAWDSSLPSEGYRPHLALHFLLDTPHLVLPPFLLSRVVRSRVNALSYGEGIQAFLLADRIFSQHGEGYNSHPASRLVLATSHQVSPPFAACHCLFL